MENSISQETSARNIYKGVEDFDDDPTPNRGGVREGQRHEGQLTRQIESVTTQIPSATFLSLALGSVGVSALLQLAGRKEDAQFIGQWVPTILILGLYNKLVKIEGSDH